MLKATKWNTAGDKEKFVKHFKNFVEQGFPEKIFTKEFYNRISMMRGHIAHYDRGGFYNAQFGTSERRADFLQHWAESPAYGDPEWTWSDAERVLAEWLQEHPEHERQQRATHDALIEYIERKELTRLTAKYA